MKKCIYVLLLGFLFLVGCQNKEDTEKMAFHFLEQYYTIDESWLNDYHMLVNDLHMSSETYGEKLLELLKTSVPDDISDRFMENYVNSREYMILPDYLLDHDLKSMGIEKFDIEVLDQEDDKVSYRYKTNIGVEVEGIVYPK